MLGGDSLATRRACRLILCSTLNICKTRTLLICGQSSNDHHREGRYVKRAAKKVLFMSFETFIGNRREINVPSIAEFDLVIHY